MPLCSIRENSLRNTIANEMCSAYANQLDLAASMTYVLHNTISNGELGLLCLLRYIQSILIDGRMKCFHSKSVEKP